MCRHGTSGHRQDPPGIPQAAAETAAGLSGAASLAQADPWALSCWKAALNYLIATERVFTADDVRDLGVPELDRPGAAGGLFAQAAAAGRIVAVGVVRSRRAPRHGARIRQWVAVPVGVDLGCGVPQAGQLC